MKRLFTILTALFFSVGISSQDFISHSLNSDYFIGDQIAADFDNDGDLDLYGIEFFYAQPNALVKMTNHCDEEPLKFTYNLKTGIEANRMMSSGDYNGDGYIDVMISIGFTESSIWYYKNDGTGSFEAIDLGIKGVQYAENFDYDADGDIDLIVKDKGANFNILVNDGNGNFTNSKSFSLSGVESEFKIADFDDDGLLDIVLGEDKFIDSEIFLYHNKGNFQFEEILLDIGVDYDMNQLQICDINKDGKMDIMYVENKYFNLLINKGNNEFAKNQLYERSSSFGYYSAFALSDIDYDGDIDIFLCDYEKDGLIFYKNSGDSNYQGFERTKISIASSENITIGDFTCDGKNDIFIKWESNRILENNFPVSSYVDLSTRIECYPNPVNEMLYFDLDETIINKIEVTDMNGKSILKYKDLKGNTIDVSNLKSGFYVVKMISGDKIYNSKFIKN
ncbi:MAG: T9SS type A sorting domain-containing protein [Saprospiraceae bacterium]